MEQFKLKSIDELDIEFVSKSREQAAPSANRAEPKASLIPEISKKESVKRSDETIGAQYFQKKAEPVDEIPIYKPDEVGQAPKKARPLVPIGQNPPSYIPQTANRQEQEDLDFSKGNYGEAKVEQKTAKKVSGGALAGKIISIVLLAATVLTFVLGCFVTIFLDNNGSSIGGICFNTMGQDIESLNVSEGDLIISKKVEISKYLTDSLIAVPSSNLNGCDIQSIQSVNAFSTDDAEITTVAMQNGIGYQNTVMASSSYGIVTSYIPSLGNVLRFAMDNAILVCILFILLAAFWCLLLVLIEKQSKSAKTKKVKKQK